ncbi:orotate phosphoribosyltransferase [bacterium]|nr:orotate phosphoribosyltransferase [bacterium]
MNKDEILQIFKEKKAFLEGHFKLSSGLHSKYYLQSAQVLQYPELMERLCADLAGRFDRMVEVVVSPAVGGIIVGQEVARNLKKRAIFCERKDGVMTLRRGFKIGKKEKVLIIEDVITTGKSIKEVMGVVEKEGGVLVGIGALVNRGNEEVEKGVRQEVLLNLEIKTYKQENCPMCKQGISLEKPGSREEQKNGYL